MSVGSALFRLSSAVLIASLILGGGARAGYLSDAVLQLIAIPLLLVALWRLPGLLHHCRLLLPLAYCCAIFLLPLLQLVPLPPSVWTALPGREAIAETLQLVGAGLPWLPLSVAPHATWLSAASLIVPLAIFLGTAQLSRRERRLLSLITIGMSLCGVFLGLVQVALGPSRQLQFFPFTDPADAVATFANRNHFAALLYTVTLFASAWAMNTRALAGARRHVDTLDTTSLLWLLAGFTVLVILVAAQTMTRSRMGLTLTIVALLGALALAVRSQGDPSTTTARRLLLGATALALTFAAQFALFRVMERFAVDPVADTRLTFARTTIEAARAFMPLGSGLGTFVPVYAMFEKPEEVMPFYANRAHNDVLELWLEAGAAGLTLFAAFILWLTGRTFAVWRRDVGRGSSAIDTALARAASMAVVLLLVHSLVDYPLRTGAIMAVFAFACALLIDPPPETDLRPQADARNASRSPADAPYAAVSAGGEAAPRRRMPDGRAYPHGARTEPPTPLAPSPPPEDWSDMQWPEAWRKGKERTPPKS